MEHPGTRSDGERIMAPKGSFSFLDEPDPDGRRPHTRGRGGAPSLCDHRLRSTQSRRSTCSMRAHRHVLLNSVGLSVCCCVHPCLCLCLCVCLCLCLCLCWSLCLCLCLCLCFFVCVCVCVRVCSCPWVYVRENEGELLCIHSMYCAYLSASVCALRAE